MEDHERMRSVLIAYDGSPAAGRCPVAVVPAPRPGR
ncbi:hypothetical protein BKA00_005144 [Actinomadura coerulea]|uniref:Universal stress protein n=1 Tax=Actinomadura coerulea TaxID=46159 RepID=A0A7X0G3Y0_9ACTN|nr:hypothetical protein [Actinomadura coerulea]